VIDLRCRPIDEWIGPRTWGPNMKKAPFGATWERTRKDLIRELEILDARDVLIGLDVRADQIRQGGRHTLMADWQGMSGTSLPWPERGAVLTSDPITKSVWDYPLPKKEQPVDPTPRITREPRVLTERELFRGVTARKVAHRLDKSTPILSVGWNAWAVVACTNRRVNITAARADNLPEGVRLCQHCHPETKMQRLTNPRVIPATYTNTPEAPEPMLQFFAYAHLPERLQTVSASFSELAHAIVAKLPRNPERTVALRKLLESKDAAVRAMIYRDPS